MKLGLKLNSPTTSTATKSQDISEAFAICCARGNNGGEWSTHYTEDQKNFWRKFVQDLIKDIKEKL